jgi:hypothetical protein
MKRTKSAEAVDYLTLRGYFAIGEEIGREEFMTLDDSPFVSSKGYS